MRIIGVVAMGAALMGALLVNVFMFTMIRAVNRRLSNERRIPYVAAMPAELVRLFREYRLLYPNGRLNVFVLAAAALALIGFFVFVASVQFM